jgi:alkylation response protein AidB-like acyl-CoA dehydrogenase
VTGHADLSRIISTVVAPAASMVDQQSRFPREAVKALGGQGFLGMTVSRGVGGGGRGLREASRVVEEVARHCGGTATVLRSHFAAVAVLDKHGDRRLRAEIAGGRHLSTLALFDAALDGYFPSPAGTASRHGEVVDLHDSKSWVISAGEADSYVWSSRPVASGGSATLWLVPGQAPGLLVPSEQAGIGLRGSGSTTVRADPVTVPVSCMLSEDGGGLDTVLHLALPWFLVLGASVALGLMEGAIAASAAHMAGQVGEHRARQVGTRADLTRMRLRADSVRVLHDDALAALSWEPERGLHKLFQLTVASAEAVVTVTDLAMKVCGDAAFRRDLGIERRFRDARASTAVHPTVDAVLDLAGRTIRELAPATVLGA